MSNLLLKLIQLTFSYGLLISPSIIDVCHGSHSSISTNNGYKGVVIALSPDIKVDDKLGFLTSIKKLLQNTSSALFVATDGLMFFEEITIIIPNSWSDSVPNSGDNTYQRYSDADLIVTERESTVQSFSMQFGGCGQHALPIVITRQLISSGGDQQDLLDSQSKRLVHEWAHYRYGVFNEFGFPDDFIYPAYYSIPGYPNSEQNSDQIKITACADQNLIYNSIDLDNGGRQCQMATSNSSGQPINTKCFPVPEKSNNSFESSLMYSDSISSVKKFCGSKSTIHKHNVNSPNKQNVLCDGKDVWTVISSHKDFQNSRKSNFVETKFNIWSEYRTDSKGVDSRRTLFAIHNSNIMKDKSKMRIRVINTALDKFTHKDLPDSQMALFTYNNGTANYKMNWTKTSSFNMDNIAYDGEPQTINFITVLKEGRDMFDKTGGIFVIIIGGKEIESSNSIREMTTVCEELKKMNIKLKIIVFPVFKSPKSLDSRIQAAQHFKSAIDITGGDVFNIREEDLAGDSISMSATHDISKAFGTVLKDFSGDNSPAYQLINEKVFNQLKNADQTVSFQFTTDESMRGKKLRTYFIQTRNSDGESVINNHQLSGGSLTQDFVVGNLIRGFQIDQVDRFGDWNLTATIKGTLKDGDSLVAVAEFETNGVDEDVLTAECWLNTKVEYIHSEGPVIAYVRVNKKLDGLVSDASVKLNITYYIGDSPISTNYTVDMLDDGKGDPDITKGDGIYSQYIVDIRNIGYYSVKAFITTGSEGNVKITDKFGSTSLPTDSEKPCCGSQVNGRETRLNGVFTRIVECGSFLMPTSLNIDDYPPNSVRDLRVKEVDYDNRTVELNWSSTGSDYTSGQVHSYVIKAFRGSEDDSNLRQNIKNNFNSIGSANVEITFDDFKKAYGQDERALVKVKSEEGGVYYFALMAVDNSYHNSVVSNIAMAYIKSNVKIQSTTALNTVDVSIHPVNPTGASTNLAGLKWWEWLSIAIGCAIVLLLAIVIIICFIGKKRRKGDETDRRGDQMPQRRAPDPPRASPELEKSQTILLDNGSFTNSVEKIPNNNVIGIHQTNSAYDSGSQQNLRELSASTLSPIQSWDAKDLLTHWGRVQEAKSRQEAPPVLRIEDLESASSNRSQSYASSEDDNTAIYTNPNNWRYQDVTARPTYIPNTGYNEPIYRSSMDPIRSNTPSDNVPRYSTINRFPTQNVSQV